MVDKVRGSILRHITVDYLDPRGCASEHSVRYIAVEFSQNSSLHYISRHEGQHEAKGHRDFFPGEGERLLKIWRPRASQLAVRER